MTNEEKILDILALMQTEMRSMRGEMSTKDDIAKINIKIENVIEPQIQVLVEGQRTILETLAPGKSVDELEDRVTFLEAVVPQMNEDIQTLKKAQ